MPLVAPGAIRRHLDGVGWVRAGSEFGGVWGVNSRTHEGGTETALCKHGVVGRLEMVYRIT